LDCVGRTFIDWVLVRRRRRSIGIWHVLVFDVVDGGINGVSCAMLTMSLGMLEDQNKGTDEAAESNEEPQKDDESRNDGFGADTSLELVGKASNRVGDVILGGT